ncbi:MAG: hypothetical protein ACTHU0_00935 [Kofleriaceae bacterium]
MADRLRDAIASNKSKAKSKTAESPASTAMSASVPSAGPEVSAVEVPESRHAAETPAPCVEAEPRPAEAPFAVGDRIRYLGAEYLFSGYQRMAVLEPGAVFTVVAVAGAYSIYEVEAFGVSYAMAIPPTAKSDWALER